LYFPLIAILKTIYGKQAEIPSPKRPLRLSLSFTGFYITTLACYKAKSIPLINKGYQATHIALYATDIAVICGWPAF